MITIPTNPNGVSRWTQRTTIAGKSYVLTFDWSQRDTHWTLDLADQDGNPIRSGMKLTTNWPLLTGVIDARRPPGKLVIVDTQNGDQDPAFSDLGSRFVLVYFDPSELT